MADPGRWRDVYNRLMQEAEFRQSCEAVCLFSALGVVLSLLFLFTTGDAFAPGTMEWAFARDVLE